MNNLINVLQNAQDRFSAVDPVLYVLAVAVSLVASFAASVLYRFFYENRATGSQVHRSFPLLGISVTTLFIAVQLSLPLSLGLLGALSIIRFRTPIKEPEEVGFIMLVIASSIVCATLNFQYLIFLFVGAVTALMIQRHSNFVRHRFEDGIMIVSLAVQAESSALPQIIDYVRQNTKHSRLESTTSREGRTSLQFAFAGMKSDMPAILSSLRAMESSLETDIYFNRPGGLR